MRSLTASPRVLGALAAGAVLLYTLAVWFLVVSPKRSEVSKLDADLVATELRLIEAQTAGSRPQAAGVPVSEVLRLAKAMPESSDQSSLVLELSALARRTGVTLRSISPQAPAAGAGGATMIPVAVTVGGSYFQISRFLERMRTLVMVRDGEVVATGRLFTVQNVQLVESLTDGFPKLDGTITLNAFVYDGPIVPPEKPSGSDDTLAPTGATSAAGGRP